MRITKTYTLRHASLVTLAVLVVGIIGGYTYLKFASLLSGPTIEVAITPTEGTTTPLVNITGVARNAKYLTLAERPIFIDLEGRFSEKLLLFPGYNIIELTAGDVRGKEVHNAIEIAYPAGVQFVTQQDTQ